MTRLSDSDFVSSNSQDFMIELKATALLFYLNLNYYKEKNTTLTLHDSDF